MQTDHNSCPAQIKKCHTRYQYLRRFCNGTQSACHNEQQKNRQYQCAFFSFHAKGILHRQRNRVRLRHISHSERYQNGTPGKKYSQHLCQFFLWKGSRQRYHRTTAVGPVFLLHPVLHRKKALRKFQCKPDHRCQHHPHQCSRTAKCHRRGNAHDIACPDLCCQFRHQRCERRNTCFCWFPGAPRSAAKRCPKCKNQTANRQRTKLDHQKNACPKQQKKKRRPPGDFIRLF